MADFQRKLATMKSLLSGAALGGITTRTAGKAKDVATKAIKPNSLSNWGTRKKGATVKARYKVKSTHEAVIQPTVAPLAALLNDGGHNPWSAPKKRKLRRGKQGPTKGSYNRTEVPARHSWDKAAKAVKPKVPPFIHQEVVSVLRKVW